MTPTLHIELLGRFRLTADDAPVTTLDSPRTQVLLAYLLLQRDAPQARAHLAFQLWPDTTEAQAHANLRTLLHRLRQVLPDAERFLYIDAQTVQWRGDAPATLDVADFERALAKAAAAEQAGDQSTARTALREAVEEYRGNLLPGWYDDWVLAERERLRQAFLAGLEQLVVLLEQADEYAAAIGYAQRLLRHDPLHEATYQHLMRLHALSGDRASAVRVYRTCATVLKRELGVEPSLATREAYERLRQIEAQPPPASRSMSPAEHDRQHNLPIALSSFIGRTHELAEVRRLLARTRLLTLSGPGGCGKTRLALAAANEMLPEYSDGVWLVELAALTDAVLVAQAVATALGVREEPQRPLTATLLDALRSRHMLLVLDNCEHLVDACAQLAQTLLSACPRLRILATSRESLGVVGETTWLVPSLALPDPQHFPPLAELTQYEAVQLFVERAAATLPTFTLTQQNALDVAQICRRLDGIPLAIELAASRIKVLSVDQLEARLDDCFGLLTVGSRTALPRQQTLQATVDWSYDLLTEAEQVLFRRLAIFVGGWTLEAAEAICAWEGISVATVLDLLAHLVDKSLVAVEPQSHGKVRYRLLETIRMYALERLAAHGEVDALRDRHLEHYLALAETAEPHLRGAEQIVWAERLEEEDDNFRAALAWAHEYGAIKLAARLAAALCRYWGDAGRRSEGRTWLAAALARRDQLPDALCAKVLWATGELTENLVEQQTLFEESLRLFRALGDAAGIAAVVSDLGSIAQTYGNYSQARAYYDERLALCREHGDYSGEISSLIRLGYLAIDESDEQQAGTLFQESLRLARVINNAHHIAQIRVGLGIVSQRRGAPDEAAAHYAEALAQLRGLEQSGLLVLSLLNLAELAFQRGELAEATTRYAECLRLVVKQSERWWIANCLVGFAQLAAAHGQLGRAVRLSGAAAAFFDALAVPPAFAGRAAFERMLTGWRAELDEETFAAEWATGRALTLEQAIAEAVANGA